ncbi:MAG TPA: hydantoinase B/oxoprolinase family protein, partial [Jatrophihabitantaceae bacterium]
MAGVLSALGIGLADTTAMREQSVEQPLWTASRLTEVADALEATTRAELADQGVERILVARRAHLRYDGTDTAVPVELAEPLAMTAAFEERYRQTYSFLLDRPLIVEAVAVEATGLSEQTDLPPLPLASGSPAHQVRLYADGAWRDAMLRERAALPPGETVTGPAIIAEPDCTTVVDDGWRATTTPQGHLLIERIRARGGPDAGTGADPVLLEIFNNLFMSIAEQMGVALESTAQSVNIKERLDFSCALFDPDGNLIANAPHMPVHLGSMGTSVKEVIRRRAGTMRPGEVYAVNDPYHGGTHLPDVTVVTPVFDAAAKILFYVASRGHHAEIGGLTPGSMPAASRDVHEEGVLFDNWLLVADGRLREAETRRLLTEAKYPSRNPETNLADLRAQIAANQRGVAEVGRMIDHFGLDVVQAYMRHVQDNAEEAVRRVIDALDDGSYRYEMDCGAVISVRIRVDRGARTATIDFTGTSPQLDTNFNAPSSVATAAVLYVFRTLVADDIPL